MSAIPIDFSIDGYGFKQLWQAEASIQKFRVVSQGNRKKAEGKNSSKLNPAVALTDLRKGENP